MVPFDKWRIELDWQSVREFIKDVFKGTDWYLERIKAKVI